MAGVFDIGATIMNCIGEAATIKIGASPVTTNIYVVMLDEYQKAQLLGQSFEASAPMCLIKTSDHSGALSNRDQIKITGYNSNNYYTIREIQPSSKGLSILILSTD